MNIKSLLLGSAAALVAVSGARAADVIVADPEPVEYVRVCDAYGTGFFYIPGTETCLQIDGYVRTEIGFGDLNGRISATGEETYFTRARAQVEFDIREETEYGTLRGYIETRWQWDTDAAAITFPAGGPVTYPGYMTDNEFTINFAYIELGGFRIGKDESYFTVFPGYAGGVINDTSGGGYGPFDTFLVRYQYSNGPFTVGISLEQGDDSAYTAPTLVGPVAPTYTGWGIDDYAPHVVVAAGYDAGIVNLRGAVAFDTRDNFVAPAGALPAGLIIVGGWSAKLRADVDITSAISAFLMVLYGENSSAYTTWATGGAAAILGETWSIIGGATIDLTPKATLNAQVQWAESNGGVSDVWAIAANINYDITDNLLVRPEVQWRRSNAGVDAWGGIVRFQRSF